MLQFTYFFVSLHGMENYHKYTFGFQNNETQLHEFRNINLN